MNQINTFKEKEGHANWKQLFGVVIFCGENRREAFISEHGTNEMNCCLICGVRVIRNSLAFASYQN